jgi:hypothetical protein
MLVAVFDTGSDREVVKVCDDGRDGFYGIVLSGGRLKRADQIPNFLHYRIATEKPNVVNNTIVVEDTSPPESLSCGADNGPVDGGSTGVEVTGRSAS